MKKEKSLTRRKGEPYPLEIRLAAIGEYRLGVSRKEIAFKYSISDPTVISHWIRKFEAKRQSSVSIKPLKLKKRSIKMTENESDLSKMCIRDRYFCLAKIYLNRKKLEVYETLVDISLSEV